MFDIVMTVPNFKAVSSQESRAVLRNAARQSAEYVRQTWVSAVSGAVVLPGMSGPVNDEKYAAALSTNASITESGDGLMCSVAVSGYSDEAEQVEAQESPWDMKPGLLGGPKHKMGKHGPYVIIPFRHATPTEIGGPAAHMVSVMPSDIYAAAAASAYGQKVPLSLEQELEGLRTKLQSGGMPGSYTWKAGQFQGLRKMGSKGQSQYMTFRVVSAASDPASWWHPGHPGNPVRAAVVTATREYVTKYLAAMLHIAIISNLPKQHP